MAFTVVLAKAPCTISTQNEDRRSMKRKSFQMSCSGAPVGVPCFFAAESWAQVRDSWKSPRATSILAIDKIQLSSSVRRPKIRKVPRQPWMTLRCDVAPANRTPSMKPLCPQAINQPKARPRSAGGHTAPINPCDKGPIAAPVTPASALTAQSSRTLDTKAVAAVTRPQDSVAYIKRVSLQYLSARMPHTRTAKLWQRASRKTMPPKVTGVAS
mmetsp:Transcript_16556/g.31259  ORF Transcript_16556/g.31259 Transcript_16556/m.31259 type:complete len:213 (+) Transcript_16556:858-1496(+)